MFRILHHCQRTTWCCGKDIFVGKKQAIIILLYIAIFRNCFWLSDFPTKVLLVFSYVSAVFNISCTCWSWLQVWVSHWNVSRMTTEVAGNPLVGHTVLSARHYESGPPANATLDVVSTWCMFRQLSLSLSLSLSTSSMPVSTALTISLPGCEDK